MTVRRVSMRYFVVMNDHVIKPATNVTKCDNSGRVYFDVDDKIYRYLTFGYDCRTKWGGTQRLLVPMNSFQRFIHEDWIDTKEIEWEPIITEVEEFKEGGNLPELWEPIIKDIWEPIITDYIEEYKEGGSIKEELETPEIEETNQKNLIPEGALHKNKHHMEHTEGLT
jgi:hypothetical protein